MQADSATRRLRLLIAFDGAEFHGWQSGRSGRGAADVLQNQLGELGAGGDLVASSRTDSGVHAHGLVAHADLIGEWTSEPGRGVRDWLNARLPGSIRVREAKWVSPRFDARFGALWKEYRYFVWNAPVMNPLLAGTSWHVAMPLNHDAMREAAQLLIGRHDFHAFTSTRDGRLGDPVREMMELAVSCRGHETMITLRASGFLYKMCRGIVGTLVDVGIGKLQAEQVDALFRSDSSRTPSVNAPAQGLILWRVGYR